MPIPLVFPNMASLLPGPDVAVKRPEPYTAISALSPFVKSAVEATAAIAKDYRDSRDHQEELEGFASFFDKQGNPQIAELLRKQKERFRPDPFRSVSGEDVSQSRSRLLGGILSFAKGQQALDLQEKKIKAAQERRSDNDMARSFSQLGQIVNDLQQEAATAGRNMEAAEASGNPEEAKKAQDAYSNAKARLNRALNTRDSIYSQPKNHVPAAAAIKDNAVNNDELRSVNPPLPEGSSGDVSENLVTLPASASEAAPNGSMEHTSQIPFQNTEPGSIDFLTNISDAFSNIPTIRDGMESVNDISNGPADQLPDKNSQSQSLVNDAIKKSQSLIDEEKSRFDNINPTTKSGIKAKNDVNSSFSLKRAGLTSAISAGDAIDSTISFIRNNPDASKNSFVSEETIRNKYSGLKSLVESLSAPGLPNREVEHINYQINKIREDMSKYLVLLKLSKDNPTTARVGVTVDGVTASVNPQVSSANSVPKYIDYKDESGNPVLFNIGGVDFVLRGSKDTAGAYKYTFVNTKTNQSANSIFELYKDGAIPKDQEYILDIESKGKEVLRKQLDAMFGRFQPQAPSSDLSKEEKLKKAMDDVRSVLEK